MRAAPVLRAGFAVLGLFLVFSPPVRAEESRPNVLWIYLEDVSGWFSCYGDDVISTPNIDALASSGIQFNRFYTPAGVCSATRSSIVTGMMQTSIGAHQHRSCRASFRGKDMGNYDRNVLPDSVVPLPIRMRQAGYWTFNEGNKDDYNFEWDVNEFYDFHRSRGGWGPGSLVAGDCWKGKPADKPFFGQVQLGGGKLGGRAPKRIDPSEVSVPPYYPDIPVVREEMAHHYDCLLKTDEHVGEVIAALKRDGHFDNTLIFLFSDHGYKLHRHKQFLYEGGIQMPLIVAGPGIHSGNTREDLISGIDITASTLAASGETVPEEMEGRDFLAADYAPRDYLIAARDRCDWTIEKIRAVVTPEFKYLKNYMPERPFMQSSYKDSWEVSKRFREMMAAGEMNPTQLIFFGEEKAPEELYDLRTDPHEIHNLADDPAYADELARHRKFLQEWIEETSDQGQEPESELGLRCVLKRWGDQCVNPEYTPVRAKMAAERAALKPNIIFILCDDLGWGDLGVLHQNESKHDKKFATPSLDAFANSGVQLRQHYCPAPVCAPSRASLLTGQHQGHCEIRDNQFDKALPDNHTLATILKSAGYQTALVGKYGLQGDKRYAMKANGTGPATWPAYPTKRGFDDFFGYVRHVDGHVHYPANEWALGNSESHRTPKELWHNDKEVSAELDKCYTTDLFTAYAKHWIAEQAEQDDDSPFFMYLAYDTPHAALQVPSVKYPKGRGMKGGVQWLGSKGRMINTARGTIDSFRYPEHVNQGWTDVEERFATMVRRIDDCVGDLMQTLRDLDIDRNTLVVLSSDNGPHHESYLDQQNYNPTSFQSYGPFDGNKRDCWEGGIRVPTIATWPDRIPAKRIDGTPSQFHDWMATFADVAGVTPPANCDGVSLLPSMTGEGERLNSRVYVEYNQNGRTRDYADYAERKRNLPRKQMQVVFVDGFKGIRLDIKDPKTPFEIYDLENDPSELTDLADASDEMRKLQRKMQKQVLRMRRPNDSAKRPYDKLPIPALTLPGTHPGMVLARMKGDFEHVPEYSFWNAIEPDLLIVKDPRNPPEVEPGVTHWVGYFKVPSDGEYTFKYSSGTPSVVRLHDALLFDHDYNHQRDAVESTRVLLAAGHHPVRITMLSDGDTPKWNLRCESVSSPGTDLIEGSWEIPIALKKE